MPSKVSKPSEGYFMAKREVADALVRRAEKYAELALKYIKDRNMQGYEMNTKLVAEFERFRSFVRNSLLWDTSNGK